VPVQRKVVQQQRPVVQQQQPVYAQPAPVRQVQQAPQQNPFTQPPAYAAEPQYATQP